MQKKKNVFVFLTPEVIYSVYRLLTTIKYVTDIELDKKRLRARNFSQTITN